MKNILYIVPLFLALISCSVNKPVKSYMRTEISENEGKKIKSVLFEKKRNPANVIEVYLGTQIGTIDSRAKSFNQDDYEFLTKKYNEGPLEQKWKDCERKQFSFSKLISGKVPIKNQTSGNDSITYYYQLSEPLFIKNKKHAMFSIIVSRGPGWILDDYVVIMKKEKGKWVLLEKVYGTGSH